MADKTFLRRNDKRSRNGAYTNLDIVEYTVAVDATAGKTITAPFALKIIDVVVIGTATSSGGTVKLNDGTNDITGTIAAAAIGTKTLAASISQSYNTIAAGGTIKFITGQAADRCIVSLIVKRL